jgi:hypothetical protein
MNHTAFFGDGEKTFSLANPDLIRELENKTGHGIGAVFRRLSNQEFRLHEVLETIRLALIGGGTSHQEAQTLVMTYGVNQPIADSLELAIAILAGRMFGIDKDGDE